MPCPSSGQIKISDLVAEFGGSAPHAMSEYYRNAGLVPGNNTSVPTSGEFKLSNCYSAVNEIIHTHSSNATNQNYATVFGSNWASTVPKRIVINSGVTVGATSGNYAMNIPSGMGGTLVIDNNGNVHGHGGTSNGGTGGNAIHCVSTSVTINNNSGATIKAGGGGGGQGGTGGTGGNGGGGGTGGQGRNDQHLGYGYPCNGCQGNNLAYCRAGHNNTNYVTCNNNGGNLWTGYSCDYALHTCYLRTFYSGGSGGSGGSSGGAGGAGGAGGVGQGYNQSNASGSSGSNGASGGSGSSGSSGGTNAGNGGTGGARGQGGQGGTGGTGGTFGNSGGTGGTGSSGNTGATGNSGGNGNHTNGSGGSGGSSGSGGSGGSSGGAAGYYIYNRASITLNNNGTVAGQ